MKNTVKATQLEYDVLRKAGRHWHRRLKTQMLGFCYGLFVLGDLVVLLFTWKLFSSARAKQSDAYRRHVAFMSRSATDWTLRITRSETLQTEAFAEFAMRRTAGAQTEDFWYLVEGSYHRQHDVAEACRAALLSLLQSGRGPRALPIHKFHLRCVACLAIDSESGSQSLSAAIIRYLPRQSGSYSVNVLDYLTTLIPKNKSEESIHALAVRSRQLIRKRNRNFRR